MVGAAGSLPSFVDDTNPHALVRATASELREALQACDFPVIVWDLPTATVRIANEPAAALLGLPLDRLFGRRSVDFFKPGNAVMSGFVALSSGAVEFVQADRRVRSPDGGYAPIRVWSKMVSLDDQAVAVSVYAPLCDGGRLGRDPTAPYRELVRIAVGTANSEWRITQLSADIAHIIGREPVELVGTSVLELIHPDDVPAVEREAGPRLAEGPHVPVRLSSADGSWARACLLLAPDRRHGPGGIAFALVGGEPVQKVLGADRVEKLLLHLRRIGAELRAAGVLDEVVTLPTGADLPELGELSSRQWEILSRLLKGERVPTIAKQLFLSPSTVRNHLTAIFRKFGVHSQAELIELLTTVRPKR